MRSAVVILWATGCLQLLGPRPVFAKKLVDIFWNVTNPIFRIDNTDHIIDVNKGNIPFEYDQVNIICPVYRTGTREEDVEQYIIYNVSKEEYDSCRITNPMPRIIAVCDRPHQLMYFTITFRSFTPQPGGLEFRPGQDYYFISTSTGDVGGLHRRIGGRCATHNMKVIFKVCCDPSKTPPTPRPRSTTTSSTASPPAGSPRDELPAGPEPDRRLQWGADANATRAVAAGAAPPTPARPRPPWAGPPSPTTTTPTAPPQLPPRRWFPTVFPPRPPRPPVLKTFDVPVADGKKSSKKTPDNRDKLPNETRAKNEELVNGASSTTQGTSQVRWMVMLLATLVVAHFSAPWPRTR
ncbi:ephrin-A5 isoform X1 [Ixodes scapularis]|uniref:ephrin-A5 isoform X1 n=1 Tax=Ixodes scapularis TaxID=6945 RepID=UPI001C38F7EF|nr:ephrin-A5 isoform X1 [Ixodes scapularis]